MRKTSLLALGLAFAGCVPASDASSESAQVESGLARPEPARMATERVSLWSRYNCELPLPASQVRFEVRGADGSRQSYLVDDNGDAQFSVPEGVTFTVSVPGWADSEILQGGAYRDTCSTPNGQQVSRRAADGDFVRRFYLIDEDAAHRGVSGRACQEELRARGIAISICI